MELEVAVRGRQMGKTTDLLAWMRRAPEGEHRVLVSHSSQEAMRLLRENPDLESWQFVDYSEVGPDAWGAVLRGRSGRVVLGLDNLDIVLHRLLGWPVGALTMTGQTMSAAESVAVPLEAVETIVGWWRTANEAPGGGSPTEAIDGMAQAVWEMELARRSQYERPCQACGRTVDTNRPCPFCGVECSPHFTIYEDGTTVQHIRTKLNDGQES